MVVFALTLIRHGETAHNKANVIQGQMDVPLSQTGIRQAELLGFHLQYQQYTHVYASDLKRAMQTAESIIQQNKSFKASLLHDNRLRERKFGTVEGKSCKYLKEAAEKSNKNCSQYTPPGGETVQQVHERAVSFFHDICEMVKEHSKLDLSTDAAIGRINLNGTLNAENGKHSGQKRKWENGETDSLQNLECPQSNKMCIKAPVKKNNSSEKFKIMENNKTHDDYDPCSVTSERETSSFTKETEATEKKTDLENPSERVFADVLNKTGKHCNADSFDLSSKQSCCSGNYNKFKQIDDRGQFSVMFTDDDIRSQIMSNCNDLSNIDCPNVSLSPLVDQNFITSPVFCISVPDNSHSNLHERRLSVCSSCDDADSGPALKANILVVSHGGLLRELFRHFVEDLECSVPGGRKQALRISPNAGLSKFTVSLEENDGHPKIICLQIHDKQHLVSTSYADKIFNDDDIAL